MRLGIGRTHTHPVLIGPETRNGQETLSSRLPLEAERAWATGGSHYDHHIRKYRSHPVPRYCRRIEVGTPGEDSQDGCSLHPDAMWLYLRGAMRCEVPFRLYHRVDAAATVAAVWASSLAEDFVAMVAQIGVDDH
ncbi:hypothetical protein FRB95_009297 [Tulasnella sp. JGI-2019a]|nr:hypothetical protein FRB95_009297 [Tulasnella sp. JGI-2019a]